MESCRPALAGRMAAIPVKAKLRIEKTFPDRLRIRRARGHRLDEEARGDTLPSCFIITLGALLGPGFVMPSLTRFLIILGLIGLAAFGVIYALGNYVRPATRSMSVEVPLTKLVK